MKRKKRKVTEKTKSFSNVPRAPSEQHLSKPPTPEQPQDISTAKAQINGAVEPSAFTARLSRSLYQKPPQAHPYMYENKTNAHTLIIGKFLDSIHHLSETENLQESYTTPPASNATCRHNMEFYYRTSSFVYYRMFHVQSHPPSFERERAVTRQSSFFMISGLLSPVESLSTSDLSIGDWLPPFGLGPPLVGLFPQPLTRICLCSFN